MFSCSSFADCSLITKESLPFVVAPNTRHLIHQLHQEQGVSYRRRCSTISLFPLLEGPAGLLVPKPRFWSLRRLPPNDPRHPPIDRGNCISPPHRGHSPARVRNRNPPRQDSPTRESPPRHNGSTCRCRAPNSFPELEPNTYGLSSTAVKLPRRVFLPPRDSFLPSS